MSISPSLIGAAQVHAFRYRYKAIGIYWAERLYHDFEVSSTEIGDLGDNDNITQLI